MLLCIVKPYLIHYLINDSYNKLNNVEIALIQENIVSKVTHRARIAYSE